MNQNDNSSEEEVLFSHEQIHSTEDYDAHISPELRETLKKHEHCLDFELTEEQLQFMNENGYLVVNGLIEPELCDAVVREIFDVANKLFGFQYDDESTWDNLCESGIIDIWHASTLYVLRQHPKLYSVFCQLLKTHKLCVSLDRVSIKHPARSDDECIRNALFNSSVALHNDTNLWAWHPYFNEFQAGVCLADCPKNGGGFFCIPKMHKRKALDEYKKKAESGAFGKNKTQSTKWPGKTFVTFEDHDLTRKNRIEVPLKKGDVVIWSIFLPHTGGFNCLEDYWRLHAYVRLMALEGPCTTPNQRAWAAKYQGIVRESMQTGKRPERYSTVNRVYADDSEDLELKTHQVPQLTPLGEKLFGIKHWDD